MAYGRSTRLKRGCLGCVCMCVCVVRQALLLDPGPYMVVCDEGHVLRNAKSGVSQAVQGMSSKRRIVLTGTPLQVCVAVLLIVLLM